ncbi:NUDIX domain-containing protein [Nonomuraea sp. NPDC050310]|uniref:NUDIX hydrolase n=1 Tax=Nonomuraea sp. NPDC050310 TaxID=3154935 RepID=UPI0033C76663
MEQANDRPAARVVALDREGRVLLMHWRDYVSGAELWEPPGGGIDPGESALEAARRELTEETGLPGSAVEHIHVLVERDFTWLGERYVKSEPFYLARLAISEPPVDPGELTEEERRTYLGYGWFDPGELPPHVEPPDLAAVISELT